MSISNESASDRVNILLVDDRPENLVALRAVLDEPDYNLVEATSGVEALRHLLVDSFALILLDVIMPDMDGFKVASMIRQRAPAARPPIIFLTASGGDVGSIYRAYSAGAVDYLVKPIDPDVVRAKVAVFVDLFRKGEQIKRQAAQLRESERRERALLLAEQRRASEERYRNLADAVPHIVWVAGQNGALEHVNRRWGEYTGLQASDASGWGWLEALHPEDRGLCADSWQNALHSGTLFEIGCRLRHADGSYRWQLCRALPERDRSGRIVAWLGTYTDIEGERQAQADAHEALRVREEFLSIASHELKTPLTALRLQTKLLIRSAGRNPQALIAETALPRLHTIDRQVERLTELVEHLLDVSRITAGRIELEPQDIDLADLVQQATERHREEIEGAGCSLELLVSGPVVGRWDAMRLDQVVTNLLTNAMKYGRGKPIEIRVETFGERARFSVRDGGIGIRPQDVPRIFGRFERVTTAREYTGFGLGLWIVRQILEAMGGEIYVASQPGRGSQFTVELPCGIDARAGRSRGSLSAG